MTDQITQFTGANRFLSNFWYCPVAYEGLMYTTSEHAFQAAKTLDSVQRVAIQCIATPGKAKRFARAMPLRADWNLLKIGVMQTVVSDKFQRNWRLRQQLRDTGDALLIEGNTWNDTFWGVCGGIGQNHLGQILMQVRAA